MRDHVDVLAVVSLPRVRSDTLVIRPQVAEVFLHGISKWMTRHGGVVGSKMTVPESGDGLGVVESRVAQLQ